VTRKTKAANEAQERLNRRALPPGILEKADAKESPEDRLIEILKDCKNHEDALELSGADYPVEPSEFADSIPSIMKRKGNIVAAGEDPVDPERLAEALRFAASLTAIESPDDLLRAKEQWGAQMREEFAGLIKGTLPFTTQLLSETRYQEISWLKATLTDSPMLSVAGLVMAVAGFSFTPLALSGILLTAVPTVKGLAKKWSRLPADYQGTCWPFVLMFGEATPTYEQIKELRRLLRQKRGDLPKTWESTSRLNESGESGSKS